MGSFAETYNNPYTLALRPCKVVRIPESRKLYDRGIRNPLVLESGIQDPLTSDPESRIHNVKSSI